VVKILFTTKTNKVKARRMPKEFVPYFTFSYLLITSLGVWAQSHLGSGCGEDWIDARFCLALVECFDGHIDVAL